MDISTRKEDKAMVVTVIGRMDAVTASDFENALAELMDQGDRIFVIDFTELDYISSGGLHSIFAVTKKLKGMDGKLSPARVARVIAQHPSGSLGNHARLRAGRVP